MKYECCHCKEEIEIVGDIKSWTCYKCYTKNHIHRIINIPLPERTKDALQKHGDKIKL